VAHVRTLFLLPWRNLRGRFTGWDGIASHCFLEPGRREDESQANRFGASVLQTYPGISRNKRKSPHMDISLLIAEPNVGSSSLDQQYFILGQVLMLLYGCAWGELLSTQHEVLRAVVFRADLQDELGGGGGTAVSVSPAGPEFAFVLF
jgi:hypothetical protein